MVQKFQNGTKIVQKFWTKQDKNSPKNFGPFSSRFVQKGKKIIQKNSPKILDKIFGLFSSRFGIFGPFLSCFVQNGKKMVQKFWTKFLDYFHPVLEFFDHFCPVLSKKGRKWSKNFGQNFWTIFVPFLTKFLDDF